MKPTVDSRERFTDIADVYARYRPSYPAAAIDWILETTGLAPGAPIVDLGCGTGIASRLFAARGHAVTGVDPNEEMLRRAREKGGGPTYVRGESAATGLPPASFDLATAAQAFHWFDLATTVVELARILRPPRWTCAFWNSRVESPAMLDYEAVLARHSAEYGKQMRDDARAGLSGSGAVRDARMAEFTWGEELAFEEMWGRARSSSYVLHGVRGAAEKAALEEDMRKMFGDHAVDGRVPWRSRTEVICFRVAAS